MPYHSDELVRSVSLTTILLPVFRARIFRYPFCYLPSGFYVFMRV
uniref:Uncharacterized protein n=1 Tax=uncultured alpha proteobacterium HF0010_13E22 TaxID=710801 RepID=E0XQY7_9PROT|nr:hypothetical protein [uncultured alpha proteobacterium HF0010_13E22]